MRREDNIIVEVCLPRTVVRDKSNLKSDTKIIRKLLGFFDRDLSTGHVTSFSM